MNSLDFASMFQKQATGIILKFQANSNHSLWSAEDYSCRVRGYDVLETISFNCGELLQIIPSYQLGYCSSSLDKSWKNKLSTKLDNIRVLIPVFVCWFAWLESNDAKHRGKQFSFARIIWRVSNLTQGLTMAGLLDGIIWTGDSQLTSLLGATIRRHPPPKPTLVLWHLPETGRLKLNVDGSRLSDGTSGGGGLVRGHDDEFLFAFHEHFGEASIMRIELKALISELQLCDERGLRNVDVEMDARIVVLLVQGFARGSWDLAWG